MRHAIMIVLVALATTRSARATEIGFSATTSANVGPDILNVATFGGDVFVGHRVAPRITLEGSFVYAFENGRWKEPTEGAPCSGSLTHHWGWEGFAARMWIEAARGRRVRFSIAPPSIGVGLLTDDTQSLEPWCSQPRTTRSWIIAVGLLGLSLDIAFTRDVELRAWSEAVLLMDGQPRPWLPGTIGVSASIGPTLRF